MIEGEDICPICGLKTLFENCSLLMVWCENPKCRFEGPWADSPEHWQEILERWKESRDENNS